MRIKDNVLVRVYKKDIYNKCVVIPKEVDKVNDDAFNNVYSVVERINFDKKIENCKFVNGLTNLKEVCVEDSIYDLTIFKDLVSSNDFNYSKSVLIDYCMNNKIAFLKKSKIKYSVLFLSDLDEKSFENMYKKENYKHFLDIYDRHRNFIESLSLYGSYSFYKFAYSLGCFSNKKIVMNGKEIEIGQKACSFLDYILENKIMGLEDFAIYMFNLESNEPNEDFLKFITYADKQNIVIGNDGRHERRKTVVNYPNLKFLMCCGKNFGRVINEFENIMNYKFVDERGLIIDNKDLSIKKKIECYLNDIEYENVEIGNEDIVREFKQHPILNQKNFDKAQKIRQEAKNSIHHIVGYELKEDVIKDRIGELKNLIEEQSFSCKDELDKLYAKEFTYEWLDKHDAKNFTLGLYCDCCANICNTSYGIDILKQSVVNDDVQNMIIRDKFGNIVAKATVYINRSEGYAVFNDIEMNRSFGNEKDENDYSDDRKRDKIYKAFKRGMNAFIEKYNEKSDIKITQVNVGWSNNRLKQIIKKYECKADKVLDVIDCFNDAKEEQWVIYKK